MGYTAPAAVVVVVALAAAIIALTATSAESFLPATTTALPITAHAGRTAPGRTAIRGRGGALSMKYVPDGLTPEQWKKMQAKEADKKKKQDLGYVGVKGFKSRSLQAWQEANQEAGSGHLFPVNPKKVKSGEISQEKTPYMQRGGGAWDDSDLAKKQLKSREGKKITKKQWSATDKAYAAGGNKKELNSSVSPADPLKRNASKSPGSGKKGAADAKGNKGNDAARNKAEESKLKSQLKSEGKKGLFGLW